VDEHEEEEMTTAIKSKKVKSLVALKLFIFALITKSGSFSNYTKLNHM
jgi:hypothetical protein